MPENVRLQNLRDFTVQIRDPENKEIVGTGIVISPYRIITCAHVVQIALGVDLRDAADRKVIVYFPQISSAEAKTRYANVESSPIHHDDDMIILRLIDGPAPLGLEQIAELGTADNSEGHKFLSCGYSPTLEYPATRADGNILGSVEPPAGKILYADPIQISSQQIDHGMSGAAVLDTESNLVVGLVAARYFPETWAKGDIAYAVDAKVLTFNPFCFKLREEALPLRSAPMTRIDVFETKALRSVFGRARKCRGLSWNNAPPSIHEWVGRADLLKAITIDWTDLKKRVTGLIGFGGEGKSSLVRRWIDDLLKDTTSPQPEGVFWWGFYDRPSVDEFFEAALDYLSGGNVDLARRYPSSSARVHLLAGMLHGGRYLFVLDGLETVQHQEGDQFGLLKSNDLRDFLQFFAASDHNSFCLVTSRAPLLDLMEYTTYQHHDLEHLSAPDGRELLQKLDVKGTDAELDKVVADWDGHALTLSLIASYLFEHYAGNVTNIDKIPAPTSNEPKYERISRILRRYDEHLTETGRAFLMIFSAFRRPVQKSAFKSVFRTEIGTRLPNTLIAKLDNVKFNLMLSELVRYRLIRCNLDNGFYTTHPLIRNYYYLRLVESSHEKLIHEIIMYYYLAICKTLPLNPSIHNFTFQIEAVYHACRSDLYDDAISIIYYQISEEDEFWPIKLGFENSILEMVKWFFPEGNIYQEPLCGNRIYENLFSNREKMGFLISTIAECLMNVGYLQDASYFFERANSIFFWLGSKFGLINISRNFENLAHLSIHLGRLDAGNGYACMELIMACIAKNKKHSNVLKMLSYAYLSRISFLKGELETARYVFQQLENLENSLFILDHPTSNRGIYYSEYLRRIGDCSNAKRIAEYNLSIMNMAQHLPDISSCHRVLGDIDSDLGKHNSAHDYYNKALTISRRISRKDILIEVLSSRGRWLALSGNADAAFGDLQEALDYCTAGGYRILETDIRIGLAWAHIAAGDKEIAKAEAIFAKQMSEDMGYYWGKKDADKVLAKIEKASL